MELTFHRKDNWLEMARRDKILCRLVRLKNVETGRYHLYVIHVPVDLMPSAKFHFVEALLYAALLTMVASRRWLKMLRHMTGTLSGR